MNTTGFHDQLGPENCLSYDQAITYIYHHVLDPAICIYECKQRVFLECQNLPKRIDHPLEMHIETEIPLRDMPAITPIDLWTELSGESPPRVIDVREPREFNRMRILQAQSISLFRLLSDFSQVPNDEPVIFVCHGGRRSSRAAYLYAKQGYNNIRILEGGMLAWEAACLLEAVEEMGSQNG